MGWGCEGPRASWRWYRADVLGWLDHLVCHPDRPVVAAMIYGSVCSGIEAASQAWHPLGWKPAFFSEIDKFPSAVLAHHYGSNMPGEPVSGNGVPNYGDMTDFERWPDHAIDILVGGTPCQDYSLAGLRKGMAGDRGSLTLTFIKIAARYRPRWFVWENVPGVLSSNDGRDFARFLGDITGTKIDVPKDGWRNSGIVAGIPDAYGVAYVVRDAQFIRVDGFGRAVPQRRRRVFVVGYIGDWRCAAAVLFEPESLQGNPAPIRKAGQGFAGDVAPSLRGCGVGTERSGDTRGQDPVIAARIVAIGETIDPGFGVCGTLSDGAHMGGGLNGQDAYTGRILPVAFHPVDDGTSSTIQSRDHKGATDLIAAYGFQPRIARNGRGDTGDIAAALNAESGQTGKGDAAPHVAIAYAIQERAICENPNAGPDGIGVNSDGASYTLEARGVSQAVAFKPSNYTRGKDGAPSDVFPPLSADADKGDQDAVVFAPIAFQPGNLSRGAGSPPNYNVFPTLKSDHGRGLSDQFPHIAHDWAVRRLTPTECERLMGFPDGFTQIPWRGKPAAQCPDGPRYKALGNSMAVNVMRWIGRRIEMIEGIINA